MKSRTLLVLLGTLAVMAALAVAVSLSQRPGHGTGAGALLLPDLEAAINTVDKLVVRGGGDTPLATIQRGAAGWGVGERHGYPADIARLRKTLLALARATIIEEKTSNPAFYDRLQVEDIENEAAAGLRLDIGSGSQLLASVIIGSTGVAGSDSAYARRAGENQSWLVKAALDLPRDATGWLDQRITAIPASRIATITITQPDGASLQLEKARAGEADFSVARLPAGRHLSFPGVGNVLGGILADLDLDAVEPWADFKPGKGLPTLARFGTFDGLVVEIRTWQLAEGARVHLSASVDEALAARYTPAPATAVPAAEAALAADAIAAATHKDLAAVETEAAKLNARLAGWVYALPSYKIEQLTRRMEELLAP
ncbi:MAG: DUF4340 domain-containing protein [Gammaproteobacteria bacterium]|nr:DUF4340 domain-containing protein [Gammaproteobacteria bacterium]